MKHIKSYEQFLTEGKDTAKEIEKKINKMGEVQDDEKQLQDTMDDTAKGPTSPPEELDAEAEKEEEANEAAKNEDHEEMGDKVLNMGVGDLLDIMKEKDPTGYKDLEMYIKKNVAKSADESWFTTMTA